MLFLPCVLRIVGGICQESKVGSDLTSAAYCKKVKVYLLQAMNAHGGYRCKGPHIHSIRKRLGG